MEDNGLAKTTLRILETTDLHMQLDTFDYLRDQAGEGYGLRGLVPVITQARNEGIATILCDNGDFLQGTPLADTIAMEPQDGVHPMIAAFNALDYDAITLGNHEFNYGTPWLRKVLSDSKPAIVSANVRTSPRTLFVEPWTIVTKHMQCDDGKTRPLRIGIIGFVTPKVADWDCLDDADTIIADDIIDAARTMLPGLRRAGADIIIALSHSGIVEDTPFRGMENAAVPLAALDDIDVVLTGHTHDLFPSADFQHITAANITGGTLHGTPAVMAGRYGSHLGVVDLQLEFNDGRWQVTNHNVTLRPAVIPDGKTECPGFPNVEKLHEKTRARLKQPLSYCDGPMRSHFAAIGTDPASRLIADAMIEAVRPLQNDSPFADLPLVASATNFRVGGRSGPLNYLNIDLEPLSHRQVNAMSPFNNPVCTILRRGWQLRAWLEHTATYFEQITPGLADQPLINQKVPSYSFDTLFGLTYRFDLSKPAHNGRVIDLAYQGRTVLDDDLFLVATNSYRANGGGGLEPVKRADIAFNSPRGVADELTTYLSKRPKIIPDDTPAWSFAPCPDTSVVFQSAATARADQSPLPVTQLVNDSRGFTQFRLHL